MTYYWMFLGILHLLILTYQDIWHKRLVDERHNWFMMGATISLLALFKQPIVYLLSLFMIVTILFIVIKKKKLIGIADNQTIVWSFIGFGIISVWILLYYTITFTIIMLLYQLIAWIAGKWFFKRKLEYIPFYPVFLISFILVNLIWLT